MSDIFSVEKIVNGDLIEKLKIPDIGEIDREIPKIEKTYANKMESKSDVNIEKLDEKIKIGKSSMVPKTGGTWSGEEGNSIWTPDSEVKPGDRNGTNKEGKTWGEIKEEYKFESIEFKENEADFSEVSKGNVEIEDFTDDRSSNFDQADEKLAEQRGCQPEEVAEWRAENKYTWHECKDCKNMQKVPREVHGNIPHSGGVSEYKSQKREIE